ncbi:hypothetical protein [Brucella pituitosa]|uniref:hypothetical protein n=1 Tax=Brucella pituitosa TaxID=571256 RepID=UPI003F4ADFCA
MKPATTRPAAPVEGLETVEYQVYDVYGRWQSVRKFVYDLNVDQKIDCRELVTRSQAETIIVAKDAEIKQLKADLQSHIDGTTALVDEKIDAEFKAVDLEADNAELTARVKELEEDVSAYILSAEDQDKRRKTLETQLAAALGGKSNG